MNNFGLIIHPRGIFKWEVDFLLAALLVVFFHLLLDVKFFLVVTHRSWVYVIFFQWTFSWIPIGSPYFNCVRCHSWKIRHGHVRKSRSPIAVKLRSVLKLEVTPRVRFREWSWLKHTERIKQHRLRFPISRESGHDIWFLESLENPFSSLLYGSHRLPQIIIWRLLLNHNFLGLVWLVWYPRNVVVGWATLVFRFTHRLPGIGIATCSNYVIIYVDWFLFNAVLIVTLLQRGIIIARPLAIAAADWLLRDEVRLVLIEPDLRVWSWVAGSLLNAGLDLIWWRFWNLSYLFLSLVQLLLLHRKLLRRQMRLASTFVELHIVIVQHRFCDMYCVFRHDFCVITLHLHALYVFADFIVSNIQHQFPSWIVTAPWLLLTRQIWIYDLSEHCVVFIGLPLLLADGTWVVSVIDLL